MNDIEREVRDMLLLKSEHAPNMDEPTRDVLRRARVRKVTNSVGVLAVIAILAVGSTLLVRSLGTSKLQPIAPRGLVPWASIPVVPVNKQPACNSGDLTVSLDLRGVGSRLKFVATGNDVRCFIDAAVGVKLFDRTGNPADVRFVHGRSFGGAIYVQSTAESVDFVFDHTDGCLPTVGRVEVTLAHGAGTLSGPATGPDAIACAGGGPNTVMFRSFANTILRDPGLLGNLAARIEEVPATVAPGATLRYVVRLTNNTGRTVEIASCPTVTQVLGTGVDDARTTRSTTRLDMLNCGAAPLSIANGSSVRFEMKIAVPGNARLGAARIAWGYDAGNLYQPTDQLISTAFNVAG